MSKPGMIKYPIRDLATLYASYMSFVAGGGLFVPSNNRTPAIGEELFIIVTLPEISEQFPLTGKVIWIMSPGSPKAPGFGIQLTGNEGLHFKTTVEKMLTGHLDSHHQTFTM